MGLILEQNGNIKVKRIEIKITFLLRSHDTGMSLVTGMKTSIRGGPRQYHV